MGLKTDFQRSDVNSQDPLNLNFKKIEDYIEDTGWLPLTLSSEFRQYSSSEADTLVYRRIGKDVEIKGVIQPTAAIPAGGSATIATLPPEIAGLTKTAYTVCHGSAKNTWLATVEASGVLKFARYGATSNIEADTNVWLPLTIRYFID